MTDPSSRDGIPPERYVIERTLGRGGMATVYLARDSVLDRPVALKVLAAHFAEDAAFRERFLREARLAARLVHPNVVQVYDVGEDERGPFIVMELVEGDTLADELRRRGRLPAADVVAIGIQLCSALAAAHSEQLVHRDIKPQNILRRPDGQVKIADFGVARSLAGTSQTELGTVLGTAAYLAPEQARGEPVTAAADIYSLGVVLYELLTGVTPFRAETLPELLLQREQDAVTPPGELEPGIPTGLEAVVMRCLAFDAGCRPSAATLAHDLAASAGAAIQAAPRPSEVGATEVLSATAVTAPLRADRASAQPEAPARRRRLAVAAAVLVLLLLGLILALALTRSGSGQGASGVPGTGNTTTAVTLVAATSPATTSRATSSSSTPSNVTTAAPAPATPDAAIASAREAILRAESAGQLDNGAGDDLNHRLDGVAKALGKGKGNDVAHKVADLARHLSDLSRAGRLTGTAFTRIDGPLTRLAALVPSPAKGPKPPKGH